MARIDTANAAGQDASPPVSLPPPRPRTFLATLWCLLRLAVAIPCSAYALFLVLLALALPWIGERNLTLAFILYLPRVVFLLPLSMLLPAALICCRRIALPLAVSGFVFFVWGMGFRFGSKPEPAASVAGGKLTVLSYNRGQHMNQSLRPFLRLTEPDLVVLQEAGNRAALYASAEGYEAYVHTIGEGHFTLLSRYPVLASKNLTPAEAEERLPSAARFEIDFEGTPVAVYAVHAISPRGTLLYYRRGAFLYGALGLPGTRFAQVRKENQVYWDGRIAEMRRLRDLILADPLPVIVAGDFNAPAGGYIHRLLLDGLQDAHLESGAGFGYTFPGTTRNPLSLGGPWMRIDYLFCDEAWEPIWCVTERDRPSQHRALTAQFRLRESP